MVAILSVAIPAGLALDHGGRFAWGWWLLAVLASGLVVGAVLGKSSWQSASPIRWAPPVLLLLFAGFAALQSVPLPASLVRPLAPGSAAAFEDWLPAANGESPPTAYSLSVAPGLSREFAARAVVVAAFAFVAVVVFANPQLATILLGALAATAVLHASLGIYQRMTVPGDTLGGIHLGQPFGFFVNRNNAAGLLNVGLAGAVGLVAWRIRRWTCPTSTPNLSPHDQPPRASVRFPGARNEPDASTWRLMNGTHDTLLIFAVVCGVIAAAGIIASGSRGALVGSAAGFVACLFVAVPAGRFLGFGLAAVLVFVAATYSLTSLGLESQAIERLSETMDEPVLNDGRLDHWPDAVRAAAAYLPLGAGLGSYRYSHLPYQQSTYGPWFANADNQWLEWWVEGGLVALLLIVAAVVVVGLAIRRLLTSLDPIDRGMAAAGAYGLFAILVSQLFDFALLISPIAIATTLLLSAVVARAAMVGRAAMVNGVATKNPVRPPVSPAPGVQSANEARLAAASRKVTALPRSAQPTAPAAGAIRSGAADRPEASAYGSSQTTPPDPTAPAAGAIRSGAADRPEASAYGSSQTTPPAPTAPAAGPPISGHRLPVTGLLQTALGLGFLLCLFWALPVTSAAAHSQNAVFASEAARGSSILSLQPLIEAEAGLSERLEIQPDDYAVLLERTAVRVQLFRLHEAAKAIGTSRATYQAAYDHSRVKELRKEFYDAIGPIARLRERDGVRVSDSSLAPLGERVRERGSQQETSRSESDSPLARLRERDGVRVSQEGSSRSESSQPPEPTALAAGRQSPDTGRRSPDTESQSADAANSLRARFGYDQEDGPASYLHLAAADARAAMRMNPLSPEPRIWLARLDFVTGEMELTEKRLEQIAQLRSGNLETLGRVVDLAVQSRHWNVARDAWKRMLTLSPARVPAVLSRLRKETPLSPSEVVPDDRAAILAAAQYELDHADADSDPDPKILTAAQKHLTPALSDQERALKEKIKHQKTPSAATR